MRGLYRTVASVACLCGTLLASPAEGQRPSVTGELTAGTAVGTGGEYTERQLNAVHIALGIRRMGGQRIGIFAQAGYDWLGLAQDHNGVCIQGSSGECLEPYPWFSGPVGSLGVIARSVSGHEVRFGAGAAAYNLDEASIGALTLQADLAVYPVARVAVVMHGRWIAVPRYRGQSLAVLPWGVGIRFR